MSYVNAAPEYVAAAAADLANIGSTISSANSAAMGPTSSVLAAGADEVSATVAALFDAHAQAYQALSAQAAYFHEQFVQLMNGGAAQYALAEAANASPLQTIQQGALSGAGAPSSQALTAGQSVIGSAAPAGSVASSLPAAAAGAAGSSAAAVPAGHLATAASPASVIPAALSPLSTPVAAAAPTSTPVAAMQAATPDYAPATAAPAASAPVSTPAAPVEAATPDVAPATAAPASALTPIGAAPASAVTPVGAGQHAARPGTPAYSPATSGHPGSAEESAASPELRVGRHRAD